MNYKKWDNIVDSDEEVEKKDENLSILATCEQLKLRADEFFLRAEDMNDPYHFKLACVEYNKIFPRLISVAEVDSSLGSKISALVLSCKMNVACALLKLEQWKESIAFCDEVLNSKAGSGIETLTAEQELRAHYFRAYANMKIRTESALSKARIDVQEMKNILLVHSKSIPSDHMSDYGELFQTISDPRLIPVEASALTSESSVVSQDPATPKPPAKKKEKELVDLPTAWKLLREGKNFDAVSAFRALLTSPSAKGLSRSDTCQIFFGLARGCAAVGDGDKATMAFESAAESAEEPIQKASLYLRSASLRFKQRKYADALELYKKVVGLLSALLPQDAPQVVEVSEEDSGSALTTTISTEHAYDARLMLGLAQSGLGNSCIQLKDLSTAVQALESAVTFFEEHLRAILDAFSLQADADEDAKAAADGSVAAAAAGDVSEGMFGPIEDIESTLARFKDYPRPAPSSSSSVSGADAAKAAIALRITQSHLYNESLHVLTALEGLSDAYASAGRAHDALLAANRTISATEQLLSVGWNLHFESNGEYAGTEADKRKKKNKKTFKPWAPVEEGSAEKTEQETNADYLRRRRACILLGKGHMLRIAANQGLTDSFPMEQIVFLWSLAADELSSVGDCKQAQAAYKGAGKAWANAAGVEPFNFTVQGGVDPEACEEGYTAFRLSAREALRFADKTKALREDSQGRGYGKDKIITALHEELLSHQQGIQCNYDAGLCGLYFDHSLAIEAFEAAHTARKCYDEANQVLRKVAEIPDDEEDENVKSYSNTCGDICFHLGQSYMMTGKLEYAEEEARKALKFFEVGDDRKRRRLSTGLLAQALAALGKDEESDEVLKDMRQLCVGPMEAIDKEMDDVRKAISRRKRAADSTVSRITSAIRSTFSGSAGKGAPKGSSAVATKVKVEKQTFFGSLQQLLGFKKIEMKNRGEGLTQKKLDKMRMKAKVQSFDTTMTISLVICFIASMVTVYSAIKTGQLKPYELWNFIIGRGNVTLSDAFSFDLPESLDNTTSSLEAASSNAVNQEF